MSHSHFYAAYFAENQKKNAYLMTHSLHPRGFNCAYEVVSIICPIS